VLVLALAGLLAASVAPSPARDTSLRVPGTALRFGMSQAQVERALRAQPAPPVPTPVPPPATAAPAAGGAPAAAPTVRVRFFGLEGQATLGFADDVLANVAIRVANPSPHDIDYVEDDLARRGFRRRCEMRDGLIRRCDWTARAHVKLTTSETSLDAYLEPVAPPPPAVRAEPATPKPIAAALPETLWLSLPETAGSGGAATASDSLPPPLVLAGCQPVRPEIARQSGVFGRVLVEATVDSSGHVVAVRVARGVPMLDAPALECARQYRFAPCAWRGRTHPFRVTLPIRFTL
jgi:TonB family protein